MTSGEDLSRYASAQDIFLGTGVQFDLHRLQVLLQQSNDQLDSIQEHPSPDFQIYVFEVLGSSNTKLWELVDQGAGEATVAIALQQQAGRGQWGRQWQSPPGGLYLSLALTPDLAVENRGQMTLWSAWGIARALRARGIPVMIKWFNDLVVERRKLGGILTETRIYQGRISQAVVGVGMNWMNPVPETGINLQMIQTEQRRWAIASLEMLAAIVLKGLMGGYHDWQQYGIDGVLPSYEALLINLGDSISINNHSGHIIGVTPTGELKVYLRSPEAGETNIEMYLQPGTISLGYTKQQYPER